MWWVASRALADEGRVDEEYDSIRGGTACCHGVHYRNSTEVGSEMGRQIGELVATKYLRPRN